MSEKLKLPEEGALEKIKGRLNKVINRPVDKDLVDVLVRQGDLERKKQNKEQKKVAIEKNKPAEL